MLRLAEDARGVRRDQRRVRAPAASAHSQPEHRPRQSAAHRAAGFRPDARRDLRGRVSRTRISTSTRSRSLRTRRNRARPQRSGTRTSPQQPLRSGIRRIRCPTTRRHRCASSCPRAMTCVASGQPVPPSDVVSLRDILAGQDGRSVFAFRADQPLRYLALVVSRLDAHRRRSTSPSKTRPTPAPESTRSRSACRRRPAFARKAGRFLQDGSEHPAVLFVAHGRCAVHVGDDRAARERSAGRTQPRVLRGHQDAASRCRRVTWRGDPASFENFPQFFLAHELAHQWWGQAVGWKNYHEQWISEGFAQYFAALYAQKIAGRSRVHRHAAAVPAMVAVGIGSGSGASGLSTRPRQARPARLPRARLQQGRGGAAHAAPPARRRGLLPRAAPVLHGPPVSESRAPRTSSGRWRPSPAACSIASSSAGFTAATFRAIRYSTQIGDKQVVVRFEQAGDQVFDIPVTVTLTYADGRTSDVVVPVTDSQVERVHPNRRPRPPGAGQPGFGRPRRVRRRVGGQTEPRDMIDRLWKR